MAFVRQFGQDRQGVTSVEYALIAVFIAVVAYGGTSIYGTRLGIAWAAIGTAVPN